MQSPGALEISRRDLLAASAATVTVVSAHSLGHAQTNVSAAPQSTKVTFTVNGERRELQLETERRFSTHARASAFDGYQEGMRHGQCGACTVLIDGRRVNACLTLAVMHAGDSITTLEGLGQPENLHPMQAAFVKHDGFQCGYCTPGQICSSVAMLDEIKANIPSHVTVDLTAPAEITPAEIRERMSGNICRCGAYSNIVEAITEVAGRKA